MASQQELALFAGLGFCITQVVHKQLLAVRTACEVTNKEPLNPQSSPATGDGTVLTSRAIKVVIDRVTKSTSLDSLWRDIGSEDCQRRDRALLTAGYLRRTSPECFERSPGIVLLNLINCLKGLLPLSYHYEVERAKGHPQSRTRPELDALELLDSFLDRHGVQFALNYGVVRLWLAEYPFGGDLESSYPSSQASRLAAKRRRLNSLRTGRDKDRPMDSIIKNIMAHRYGRESMSKAVISGDSFFDEFRFDDDKDEDEAPEDEYSEIWNEVHGAAMAPESESSLGPMMRRGQRVREESLEEQALRSRRREAMVLGETGRPIEGTDIIQRTEP
ncbi:MAG: hypothetical protein L6R37_003796 [Teloschistes peruensis]|nr:MAG: hypothetical protein L6R37_003796 [Teloschistes peruensis]